MRTRTATVAALVAALVLALAPTASAARDVTVDTAEELQAALDAAAERRGPRVIEIDGEIELTEAAVYRGDRRLRITGGGTLTGIGENADVLVSSGGAALSVEDLTVQGGRRGIVVVVPEDQRRRVRVDLQHVTITGTAYHGFQAIDGVVDLAATGENLGIDLGDGTAVPDETLATEALTESEVVGGSPASIVLRADELEVTDSGRGALDQDGLRIDERGPGDIVARVDDARFTGNGADGIEYDEAGDGDVRSRVRDSAINDNGDFDVSADPDDGFDIDEADAGDLVARLRDVAVERNFDEGLDFDEDGDGDVRLSVFDVVAADNVDENLKVTELGAGDVIARVRDGAFTGSDDADGILYEEFGAGRVIGRITGAEVTSTDGAGIGLLSLDIVEGEFDDLDDRADDEGIDVEELLPTDGATGVLRVRDVTFGDNGDGPVTTFGVEVVGDVQLPAFPPAEPQPDVDYTLTVLHNNDGESDLLPAEDDPGTEVDETGAGSISRFGWLLRDQRRQFERGPDQGVVAVTSGDNFLASPEFEASLDKGVPYYDSIALGYLDYDAYTIGNHEFDFGPEILANVIDGVEGCERDPFISANLGFSDVPVLAELVDAGCIQDSTVTRRDGGRQIGVIGLTTPNLREVSSPGDVEIRDNLAEIANAEAQRLTDQGVEYIIVASHLQDIDNEVALAAELSNVDAIIGGGGGEELGEPLTATNADGVEIPVVTVPGDYFELGRLMLEFDADGTVIGFSWELLPVDGDLRQDRFLLNEVQQPVAEFVDELDQTVITTSEVPLNGVRADVRTRETNVGNLLADSFVETAQARAGEFGVTLDGPLVGLQNGGGIRNDSVIPAGPITLLDTFDIAPFTNFVSVLPDVAPADLLAAVEHGLEAVPDPEGFFAQWSGLQVEYDASDPALDRVETLTVNGTPYVEGSELLDGLEPVDIATIDFLAAGNDGYDMFETYSFTRLGTSYQQSLADSLATADLTADSVEYQPREDVPLRTRLIPVGAPS